MCPPAQHIQRFSPTHGHPVDVTLDHHLEVDSHHLVADSHHLEGHLLPMQVEPFQASGVTRGAIRLEHLRMQDLHLMCGRHNHIYRIPSV